MNSPDRNSPMTDADALTTRSASANTGSLNPAYLGPRADVLSLLSPGRRRVLDVGCSAGALGHHLKGQRDGQVKVVGLELLPEAAAIAKTVLDEVHVGDVEQLLDSGALAGQRFDAIIAADVLEHLRDPWRALSQLAELLEPGGEIIVSLPNVRHMSTLFHLVVLGHWPYRERGIHDRTHLRFFTRRNVQELLAGAGFRVDALQTKYRLIESPHPINRWARYLALPGLGGFLAYQYLVRARRD